VAAHREAPRPEGELEAPYLEVARERLRPFVEKAHGFSGWMAETKVRRLGAPPPWDYMARARELAAKARSVLDLGTGGGERFAEVIAGLDCRRVATEEWVVNAPVAARRLAPLGAGVVRCRSPDLPFRDATFDLVLDRHEELEPGEVARVLAPGGTVLTQQVWGQMKELSRFIPRRSDFGDHFNGYQHGFRDAGLEVVDARTHAWTDAFESLGEVVYVLCIAPWEVPDFDPLGADLEALLALERELSTADGVLMSGGSYVIEAQKPPA
jgi:SAM-dependent methyltransferase